MNILYILLDMCMLNVFKYIIFYAELTSFK